MSFTKDEVANGEANYNFAKAKNPIEELPGQSVFTRDETGAIFHTYSCFGRGDEGAVSTYFFLDITP